MWVQVPRRFERDCVLGEWCEAWGSEGVIRKHNSELGYAVFVNTKLNLLDPPCGRQQLRTPFPRRIVPTGFVSPVGS